MLEFDLPKTPEEVAGTSAPVARETYHFSDNGRAAHLVYCAIAAELVIRILREEMSEEEGGTNDQDENDGSV